MSTEVEATFMREVMGISDKVPGDDFARNDTSVFALHNHLLKLFGPSWFEWLPETLWTEIERDVPGAKLSRELKDRILALRLALTTNRPWVEWETFEKVTDAFCGDIANPDLVEPATPEECLTTIRILHTLRKDEEFGPEVLAYVAACFAHEGFLHVGPLPNSVDKQAHSSTQEFLDQINEAHAQTDRGLSHRIGLAFSKLWQQRASLSSDKDLESELARAEDDIVRVQLRKLYGVYRSVEKSDGLDRPLDL